MVIKPSHGLCSLPRPFGGHRLQPSAGRAMMTAPKPRRWADEFLLAHGEWTMPVITRILETALRLLHAVCTVKHLHRDRATQSV